MNIINKHMYLLLIALVCTPFLSLSHSCLTESGEQYLLRYSPEAGRSGTMIMDYSMNINMNMMGQSMSIDQQMEMGAGMKVLENTGEEISTEIVYEFFAMSMNNPMTGAIDYDSRKTENQGLIAAELDRSMGEVIGKKVIIRQDVNGNTLDAEGMEELKGMNSNQGSLDFSSIMGMSRFPEKPVAIGESWNFVMDQPSSPMQFNMTFTLQDVREGKVYIEFTSKVSSNPEFQQEDAEAAADLEVSGTQNGSFVYEQQSMWLLEGMVKQDLDMQVAQMGMQFPMKVKGNMLLVVE